MLVHRHLQEQILKVKQAVKMGKLLLVVEFIAVVAVMCVTAILYLILISIHLLDGGDNALAVKQKVTLFVVLVRHSILMLVDIKKLVLERRVRVKSHPLVK